MITIHGKVCLELCDMGWDEDDPVYRGEMHADGAMVKLCVPSGLIPDGGGTYAVQMVLTRTPEPVDTKDESPASRS